jgi:hypothetical protein
LPATNRKWFGVFHKKTITIDADHGNAIVSTDAANPAQTGTVWKLVARASCPCVL